MLRLRAEECQRGVAPAYTPVHFGKAYHSDSASRRAPGVGGWSGGVSLKLLQLGPSPGVCLPVPRERSPHVVDGDLRPRAGTRDNGKSEGHAD